MHFGLTWLVEIPTKDTDNPWYIPSGLCDETVKQSVAQQSPVTTIPLNTITVLFIFPTEAWQLQAPPPINPCLAAYHNHNNDSSQSKQRPHLPHYALCLWSFRPMLVALKYPLIHPYDKCNYMPTEMLMFGQWVTNWYIRTPYLHTPPHHPIVLTHWPLGYFN